VESIRLLVAGAAGRMGRTVLELASESDEFEVVAATERAGHPQIGRPLSTILPVEGFSTISISATIGQVIDEADVIVDFTTPAASIDHFAQAVVHKKGIVIGTTGLSDNQLEEIYAKSRHVRCVLSPNMSRAMNLLFALAPIVASVLKDFDVEIIEEHHRGKKDAPSGTALALAERVAAARGLDLGEVVVFGRKGRTLRRPEDQIAVHSVRAGEIVGNHTLLLAGGGERISLVHHVESRRTFALGALYAARFLHTAEPGIYSMQDVLGLSDLAQAVSQLRKPGGEKRGG